MKLEAKQRLQSKLTEKQKQLDINGDGKITSDDLKKLREGQKPKQVESKIGPIEKGAFHKWLGKKESEPITEADIKKGLASKDPHVVKMANFAKNAKKWK
jgi:hypothetical protein